MNSTAKKRVGAISLLELAERQCLRFHFMIEDVGDASYDLVEPILKKMTSTQLISIEKNCSQIRARSNPLWKMLIRKDFCDRPLPDGAINYRRLYVKYFKDKEEHLQDASTRLRESMNKFKKEKQARTITSLESDPRAEKSRKRHIIDTAPSGSKLIQKAYQAARTKGKMFSPKNMKFGKTGMKGGLACKAPIIKEPKEKQDISLGKKNTAPDKDDFSNFPSDKIEPSLSNAASNNHMIKSSAMKKPAKSNKSSIFLPRKPITR